MHLKEQFKQKLNIKDAITIRQAALTTIEGSNKPFDLPYIILQKIMMSDRKSRSLLLKNQQREEFEDDNNSSDEEANIDDEKQFHPIDCMLTLLLCCDDLLRQDLINKLLSCQLAVPLILPNPSDSSLIFLLWGLRSAVRSWKTQKHGEMEKRMIHHKAPIVAFVRIGKVNTSKSELLNDVVSGESKPFFCWNFDGGNLKRQFVEGLVELCWYLPASKENVHDVFPEVVTFLNLRGDAKEHPKQLQLIQKISYLVVVLVDEENMDNKILKIFEDLAKTPGGIILLLDSANKESKKSTRLELLQEKIGKQKLTRIKGKHRATIIQNIQQSITKKITNGAENEFNSISGSACIAAEVDIKVDEHCDGSIKGKQLATELMNTVTGVEDACKIKQEMLPLQGPDHWHKWAEYDKERNRHADRKETSITKYNSNLDSKKKGIRSKQLNLSKEYTAVMKLFVQHLTKSEPVVRTYFLQWLKLFLDDHSRTILPDIHAKYQRTRKEYMKEKEKESPNSEQLQKLQKDLKKQNEQLIHASFGLEHLFREMAQIYEARMDPSHQGISNDLKNEVIMFPHIIAEIMTDGHSLELMDGDASHVPITWVKAVLQSLKQKCKGKGNLFVLSILGIQSTGKSTLLNTLFGLRFNVSAGRCTRGAYIQMLPLDQNLQKQINCDNILIVDTEGLRAPELQLEGLKHDNELATFVIGVADCTMINIFGEVPGDLNDILQTSIHAFIRMKKVEMNPSCTFVHQNVPDIMANKKGLVGRQNFQAKLDDMTLAAAKVEQCDSQYKQFRDVIYFNDQTDVFYFPSLWKGDPPMAPVNPGYSEKAQALKVSVINLVKQKQDCRSSFDSLDLRITDIWSAVLQENFVFSFKNTLEVSAYNELDTQYGKWSWELQNALLEWKQKAKAKIESHNCLQADDDPAGKPNPDIHVISATLIKDANEKFDGIYTELLDKFKKFIDNSNFVQTLTQWKHSTERRLQELRDEHKREMKEYCKRLVQHKLNNVELEKLKNNKLGIIQAHIKELVLSSWAEDQDRKLTDEEIRIKFEDAWDEWMEKFKGENRVKFITDDDMEIAITHCLREKLRADDKSVIEKLTAQPLNLRRSNLTFRVDMAQHLTSNRWFKASLGNRDIQEANRLSFEYLSTARKQLEEMESKKMQFERPLVLKIINDLFSDIDRLDQKKSRFLFTPAYKVDMAIIICTDCFVIFKRIMNLIRKENDPIEKLNELKETFHTNFKNQYSKMNAEKTAANSLCNYLVQPIKKGLQGKLGAKIVTHLKDSDGHFHSKRGFKVKILTTLAEKGIFSHYQRHFDDVNYSCKFWAEFYIKDHCKTKASSGKFVICELAEVNLGSIIKKIRDATNTMLDRGTDIDSCLTIFHEYLGEELIISKAEMLSIIGSEEISNISFFVDAILEGIENIEKEIKEIISGPSSSFFNMEDWSTPPHIELFNNLAGCCETCPFCREQCEINDKQHSNDHSVVMHRPECLGKYTWIGTNKLALELCTESVNSNDCFQNSETNYSSVPYKDYRKHYKTWNIPTDKPDSNPVYWKWFVSEYKSEITNWANASQTDIPSEWKVSKETAIASLKTMYQFSL